MARTSMCPRLEDGPSLTELGSASGPAAAGKPRVGAVPKLVYVLVGV